MPPVAGNGVGFATVVIAPDAKSISYEVKYAALSGDVVAAHIHVGALTWPGPIILPLKVGPSPMTGTLTAADLKVAGGVTDFAGAVAAIRAGGTYVNLHTAAHPGGEIRGQLVPAANIPQFTILADNPAGVPAGKFWAFNDYFPRVATIASGTTISFAILGFHTATLLPAGMTAKQDMTAAGLVYAGPGRHEAESERHHPRGVQFWRHRARGLEPDVRHDPRAVRVRRVQADQLWCAAWTRRSRRSRSRSTPRPATTSSTAGSTRTMAGSADRARGRLDRR